MANFISPTVVSFIDTSLHSCQIKIPHLDFSAWPTNFSKKIRRERQCKAYEEQEAEQRRWLPPAAGEKFKKKLEIRKVT